MFEYDGLFPELDGDDDEEEEDRDDVDLSVVLEESVDVDEDGERQDGDGYDGGRVPGELVVGSEERLQVDQITHIYYIQGVPKNVLIEQNHNQNSVLWG